MSLLSVDDLDVYYGEVQALHGVSLHIETGELVGVIGPNGAGKSTLLKAISKLIKLSAGTIMFDGEVLNTIESHQVAQKGLSLIPEGRRLFPGMTVFDNLLLGGYTQPKQKRKENLEQIYALFPRLKERTGQVAGTLSGGEQQMVAIARALMSSPRLLMLDEPSLGLAPKMVEETFDGVQKISASGTTILLVEQNVYECLGLANRAYILENGQVILEGSGQDLLHNERIQQAYLGI